MLIFSFLVCNQTPYHSYAKIITDTRCPAPDTLDEYLNKGKKKGRKMLGNLTANMLLPPPFNSPLNRCSDQNTEKEESWKAWPSTLMSSSLLVTLARSLAPDQPQLDALAGWPDSGLAKGKRCFIYFLK